MISDISDSGMGGEDNIKQDPWFAEFFKKGGLFDSYISLDKISGGGANYATQEQVTELAITMHQSFAATNKNMIDGLTSLQTVAIVHSQAIGALKREIEYLKLPWYKKLWLKIKGRK